MSNIALRHLKVARFNDLNDPFELLAVDVAERNLRIGMAAKKKQIDLTEGLLCFSKTWRSPLLWSHYAEKHRGIALGFDVPDHMLVPVQYIKGLHKIKVLSNETEQSTIDKLLDRLRYTKFDGWAYEDEVRQFFRLDDLSYQSGLHFIPFSVDLVLREVILGPRCDIPIEAVRTLVEAFPGKVRVTRARIAYTKFGVVKK
ncbi:MAG: DUF2971 domain-containing protein [Betaproteobacteria bacterium]